MPETLPTAAPANTQSEPLRLVRYEAAVHAIQECARVDECKAWSDKAAALAAYAKQAKDSTLHNLALRIQQRAQRRMGELLKQVPNQRGGDRGGPTGGRPPVGETRTQVATDAGLSEHQRKTALRIASVPEPEFEAAIRSNHPPTVTEMAMRGTVTKPPVPEPDARPADAAAVSRALSLLAELAAFCGANEAAPIALACRDPDMARGHVETIDGWLDRFVTRLSAPDQEGF